MFQTIIDFQHTILVSIFHYLTLMTPKMTKRKFVADKGDYVDLDVGVGRQLKVGKNVSCREKEN